MKLVLTSLTCAVLSVFAVTASAQSNQGSFPVTSEVSSTCVIRSASNINFGEYDATKAEAVAAQGQISFLCTNGTMGLINLSVGENAAPDSSACVPKRRLKSQNGDFMTYKITSFNGANKSTFVTTDQSAAAPNPTRDWVPSDCGTGPASLLGSPSFKSVSSLEARGMPVHTSLDAGQDVKIGRYTDTIVVELIVL